jgi:murein DD-endopeptidase MepM/ murein hydrolase activator NlpD
MIKKVIYSFTIILCCLQIHAQDKLKDICTRFDDLNTQVRDLQIKKTEAKLQFQNLITEIKSVSIAINDNSDWIFPIQGYNSKAIGGYKGNGYSDKAYSYFDGNKHAAHPAHDIFISDRNQDCIDDKTHLPVNILALADGVVIACCNEWAEDSDLRGGRYIWIYHPRQNILTYYAHNREIFVTPGQIVNKGDKIAHMGRTGFNAFKKRSPTHLHFSTYRLVNNLPVAYNCYTQLVKTKGE